ncbi:MAG: ATP synthase F0 subunit A [Bdellovibrionales bacterium RIFOXYB1_FULL_37_110]|nr:MAG: ATP synthase F0 subunit A [Bdellovibrionales bacterium RIFOXYA1_FULL_38_20]OFZ50368.1 MAG: ATP synthase F0 subunit A [Bdellovibrionales bacterium RIFOXYC1_FULL_37_79]OFZ60997.1 MAG: ATP synthase F0 subunit A [Bdellovibrionales bacterium RIFOXYB1_FULL_37_110]OFZ63742.1 MAG: ATP synthase F0 subunit A [Bdellovibrionales bacterium RIFOXYD1_FULL_36_51]
MPEHVLSFIFIVLCILIVGLWYRISLIASPNSINPDKKISIRSMMDMYGKFIFSQALLVMGEEKAKQCFSFVSIIFLIIFFSNLIGLIPGIMPPTEHMSTTLALGVFSFVFYNLKGVRAHGILNYLKHFAGPLWYMSFLIFPIELVSHLFRPITLSLRLRGNIMGDHLVLTTFYDLVPVGVPIIFLFFGLMVSFIQAYVFTTLSMVYISLATKHDH